MKTAFEHGFKSPSDSSQTAQILGFTKAMTCLLMRLNEMTNGGNPASRYIDAVDLLEAITATNNQLQAIQRNTLTVLTEKMKDHDTAATA